MTAQSELRASDADREAVVERLSAALGARTVGELEALEADLPAAPAPRPPGEARGARVLPLGRFGAYLPVMALLVVIWALTGADYFWPIWPAFGWGVATMDRLFSRCST